MKHPTMKAFDFYTQEEKINAWKEALADYVDKLIMEELKKNEFKRPKKN